MRARLTILLSLMVVSCTNINKGNDSIVSTVIEFSPDGIEQSLAECVDSVSFLVLKENEDNAFGNVDKVVVENDMLYVGDFRNKKIVSFYMNGDPGFVIDAQGRGPGEYLEIHSFSVDKNHVYILDNYQQKIHLFSSLDGRFERSLDLPVLADDLEVLANGGFVLAYAPTGINAPDPRSEDQKFRVLITDPNLKITKGFLKYSDNEAITFHRYLNEYDGKIVFASFGEDKFYFFNRENGDLMESVEIKSNTTLPYEYRSDIHNADSEQYSSLMDVPFLCNGFASFVYKQARQGNSYVIDLKEKKILTASTDNARNAIVGVVGSADDYFICFWSRPIYDFMVMNGFTPADKATEEAIHRDEPFIVKCHMR